MPAMPNAISKETIYEVVLLAFNSRLGYTVCNGVKQENPAPIGTRLSYQIPFQGLEPARLIAHEYESYARVSRFKNSILFMNHSVNLWDWQRVSTQPLLAIIPQFFSYCKSYLRI